MIVSAVGAVVVAENEIVEREVFEIITLLTKAPTPKLNLLIESQDVLEALMIEGNLLLPILS